MGGADHFGVIIIYNGKPLDVTSAIFWDWDDDDEDQLRIKFTVKKPEDFY